MRSTAFGFAWVLWATLSAGAAHARPDDPDAGDLFTFDAGDVIETYGNAHFLVHFTKAGVHSVPLADDDDTGVPDHVEQLAQIYEDVLTRYTELGFRAPLGDATAPDDGGDERFDVYLVDFALAADGSFQRETCSGHTCAGFMVQENDFANYGYPSRSYANRLLASHEFFHAVQAAYDINQGAAFDEGTAVWASEMFDASLQDLEGFGADYLLQTDNSIDFGGSGPVDAYTYGTSIFWDWLARTFGDDAIVELFDSVGATDNVYWFDVIDEAMGVPFATLFPDFAAAMLEEHAAEILRDDEALPFFTPGFRSFVASFRTVCALRQTRGDLTLQTLAGTANTEETWVRLFALDGETVLDEGESTVLGPDTVTVTLDGLNAAADTVCVQVVNARKDGESARPKFCLGDADEVAACIADNTAASPGEGEGEGEGDGDAAGGCSCGATSAADVAPLALGLMLLRLPGRRQKRSSR